MILFITYHLGHVLEIVLRVNGGNYIIVALDNRRCFEISPQRVFHDDEEKLMKAYDIYISAFNAIFDTFDEVYPSSDDDGEKIEVKVELSKREANFVKKFAELQHPNAEDNLGTRFPTIHVVRNKTLLPALEDCGDCVVYKLSRDGGYETETYSSKKELIDVIKYIVEEYILDVVETLEDDTFDVKRILEYVNNRTYTENSEKLTECLSSEMSDYLDEYNDIVERIVDCQEGLRDFDELSYDLSGYLDEDIVVDSVECHVVMEPVAFFLIREEAEKYVKYQGHNLKEPDIFTYSVGYNNFGDLPSLANILLKIGNKI